jgi:hypothetical protein
MSGQVKWLALLPRIVSLPLVALGAFLTLLIRVVFDRLRGRGALPKGQTWIDTAKPVRRAEEAKAEVTAQTAEAVAPHVAEAEAVKVVAEEAKTEDRVARRKALRAMAKKVDQ